jgi:hypothetical protein
MLNEHLSSMTYIGAITLDGDRMKYTKPDGMRRKDLIKMGDLVYFMIVDGKLMKIGKAGGKTGWIGRAGMYENGITSRGDQTNVRIFRVLESMNAKDSTIHVYAIATPRQQISFTNPLTYDIINEEVAVHGNVERSLTAKYIEAGYELPFSKQLQ